MNIDDLTLGQIREIQALPFGAVAAQSSRHPMVGCYVIARCYAAGVHAGTVLEVDGENVILKDSRRLWSWKAQEGIALSGLAQHGIKSDSKLDALNPLIYLTGVCELIPCTVDAQRSIHEK